MLFPTLSFSTELVDHLDKHYKTSGYPEGEVVVRVAIRTAIKEESGGRLEDIYLQSMKVHRKMVSMMEKNGWGEDDPLFFDVIDVGDIQLVTGRGMNLKLKETFCVSIILIPICQFFIS